MPAIPALGLPAYSWEGEALHGVAWAVSSCVSVGLCSPATASAVLLRRGRCVQGVGTIFPENIGWGASWDVALVSDIAEVIAIEARAKVRRLPGAQCGIAVLRHDGACGRSGLMA